MLTIQRNEDGSFKTNRAFHSADLVCDVCGAMASGVDLDSHAVYIQDPLGNNVAISMDCADIGGTCGTSTCWPTENGTEDAREITATKGAEE